ncbi:MAG: DUF1570 domain-containing protein [Isosphaeraceae bacterium]|nr:DUF1570 domain-containing protein [Isosphaeraceae bacterium]
MTNLWPIAVSLVLQVPAPGAGEVITAELVRARSAIEQRERTQLLQLAEQLRSRGETEASAEVAALAAPANATDGPTRFLPLPEIDSAAIEGRGLANVPTAPGPMAIALPTVRSVREEAARKLFDLAFKAVAKPPKDYSLADECLRAVLERLPNHPETRRLLGYVPHKGGWATPYAVRKVEAGNVLHPTYGWVPKSWVTHLERGELPAPLEPKQREPRWLPAAEADQLHGSWDKAWKIPTEHFVIRSNVPLSEAITFSRQLEDFHQLFYSLLADLFGERLPLAQRLQNKAKVGETEAKPHEVYYFAWQPEFVEYLQPLQGPSIARSLGIYIPITGKDKRRPAYFFRDGGGQLPVTATLYHEVSHQLLFESGLGDPEAYLRNDGNYWVFEGLGTYFETLVRTPKGALEVGGLVGRRIEAARAHLLEAQEYIPLDEFVSYSQDRFNAEKSVFLHYQEAHALALFFMQAKGRQYREGFLEYVSDAYKGKVRRLAGRTLESHLGVPYKTLDAELLTYLKAD